MNGSSSLKRAVLFLACALVAVSCTDTLPTEPELIASSERLSAEAAQNNRPEKYTLPISDGPEVVASCDGFDIIYEAEGYARVTEHYDKDGELRRIHTLWNLTRTYSNSETGFSLTGKARGPDIETINEDGSVTLRVLGHIDSVKLPGGRNLVFAGQVILQFDANGELVDYQFHGNDDFEDLTVLCEPLSGE